jgi:RNA polymerase sigma-70 factor (ECF subfamily)
LARSKTEQRRLVKSHQAGDPAAFPQIFKDYYESLLIHARRRLGSNSAAEDAVQETFLRAFRALLRFNGRYRVGAWLHRILENVCADEGNRRRNETETLGRWVAGSSSREGEGDNEEDHVIARREVVQALEGLPDSYREALILRELAGLSYREMAAAIGVSEENARARVHRARRAIRKILGGTAGLAVALLGFFRRTERAIAHPAKDAVESAGLSSNSVTAQVVAQVQSVAPLEAVAAAKSTLVANLVGVVAVVAVPVSSALAPAAVSATPEDPPPAIAVLTRESSSFTDSLGAAEDSTVADDSSQAFASISGSEQTEPTGSGGTKQKAAGTGSSAVTRTSDAESTGEAAVEPPATPSYEEVCGGAPSAEEPTILWEGSRVTIVGTGLLSTGEHALQGWTQVQLDLSEQDERDPESQFDASYCHLREDDSKLTGDFTEGNLLGTEERAGATEYLFGGRYHLYDQSVNLNQWGRFSATFIVPDGGTPVVRVDFGPKIQLGS